MRSCWVRRFRDTRVFCWNEFCSPSRGTPCCLRAASIILTKTGNFLKVPVLLVIYSTYFAWKSPRHRSPVAFSSASTTSLRLLGSKDVTCTVFKEKIYSTYAKAKGLNRWLWTYILKNYFAFVLNFLHYFKI